MYHALLVKGRNQALGCLICKMGLEVDWGILTRSEMEGSVGGAGRSRENKLHCIQLTCSIFALTRKYNKATVGDPVIIY